MSRINKGSLAPGISSPLHYLIITNIDAFSSVLQSYRIYWSTPCLGRFDQRPSSPQRLNIAVSRSHKSIHEIRGA
jgi:hypothetical protein